MHRVLIRRKATNADAETDTRIRLARSLPLFVAWRANRRGAPAAKRPACHDDGRIIRSSALAAPLSRSRGRVSAKGRATHARAMGCHRL